MGSLTAVTKFLVPDQILDIIKNSNYEDEQYKQQEVEPTGEELMQMINSQYIQGLIQDGT